jgi:hypothetical protein
MLKKVYANFFPIFFPVKNQKKPEATETDRKRPETTGNDQKRPETTGKNRKKPEKTFPVKNWKKIGKNSHTGPSRYFIIIR